MKMRKLMSAFAACSVVLLVGACGDDDDGGGIEQRLCEKADECNFLEAGISVQDCVDEAKMCTSSLVSSERKDWEAAIEDCLELSNCTNIASCYLGVPGC